mmetsp:Transcript_85979/g.277720  ORF Transcript_85979/g.277720 Transcript_85979/m.277720 type:complete len:234 (-) Transcript_85979:1167-1868(-)
MVQDHRHLHAPALERLAVLREAALGHCEGHVVHRTYGSVRVFLGFDPALGQRRGYTRGGRRDNPPPEVRQAISVACVEEEMLAITSASGELQSLDQRHAQLLADEARRPRHVRRHQRKVVDAPEVEPRRQPRCGEGLQILHAQGCIWHLCNLRLHEPLFSQPSEGRSDCLLQLPLLPKVVVAGSLDCVAPLSGMLDRIEHVPCVLRKNKIVCAIDQEKYRHCHVAKCLRSVCN